MFYCKTNFVQLLALRNQSRHPSHPQGVLLVSLRVPRRKRPKTIPTKMSKIPASPPKLTPNRKPGQRRTRALTNSLSRKGKERPKRLAKVKLLRPQVSIVTSYPLQLLLTPYLEPEQPTPDQATGSRLVGPASRSNDTKSSTALEQPSKSSSRRRRSMLYSDGFSEDEYIPKEAKKLQNKKQPASTEKRKAPRSGKEKASTASATQSSTAPHKSNNRNTNKAGASQLPDIPEEDEEDEGEENPEPQQSVSRKSDASSSTKSTSKGRKAIQDGPDPGPSKRSKAGSKQDSQVEAGGADVLTIKKGRGKGSKRAAQEAGLDQVAPQRTKKRARVDDQQDGTGSDQLKPKTRTKTSRKRPRGEDSADDTSQEPEVKRKKVPKHSESKPGPKSKPSSKATKPKSKNSPARQSRSAKGKRTTYAFSYIF